MTVGIKCPWYLNSIGCIFKSDVMVLFLNANIYNMQDITTFTTIWNCDGNVLKYVIMWFLRILFEVHEKRKLEIPLILSNWSSYRGGPESQKDLPKITCQRRTGARPESKASGLPTFLIHAGWLNHLVPFDLYFCFTQVKPWWALG